VLSFSEKAGPDDVVLHSHGVTIHVRKKAFEARLRGCEVEYKDGLEPSFCITNPNAKSACGCGSSHGYS
jgi:iron-sulfur cluster assembly accessory protein